MPRNYINLPNHTINHGQKIYVSICWSNMPRCSICSRHAFFHLPLLMFPPVPTLRLKLCHCISPHRISLDCISPHRGSPQCNSSDFISPYTSPHSFLVITYLFSSLHFNILYFCHPPFCIFFNFLRIFRHLAIAALSWRSHQRTN